MHSEEPQRVTDDDGRMTPLRGEYEEEDDNDESWHDAREDWWETTTCANAKSGATAALEVEARGRVERSIQEVSENEGVPSGKSKHDITKDVRGQAGREGVLGGCGGHRHGCRGRNVPFRKGTRSGAEYETCGVATKGPSDEHRNDQRRGSAHDSVESRKPKEGEREPDLAPRPKISHSFPFVLAHTGGCAVRWGRMS